jgi:hypothetical protein
MNSKLDKKANNLESARSKVASVLIKELGTDETVAFSIADYATTLAFHEEAPKVPKKKEPILPVVLHYAGRAYRRVRIFLLIAVIAFTVIFGGYKFFTSSVFDHYPRNEVRVETWRPVPGDYTKSWNNYDWDKLASLQDGACFERQVWGLNEVPFACLHNSLIPRVNAALDKAVNENIEGEIWRGSNGNGEIWTIERRDFRFIIKRIDDPAMDY